ncbi:HAD-IC family P-type ATPase [Luteimonas sp. RD2P54]|uniref:HAD-IC family P-type ATPase n=1 Tax=Luteimonas endophytica TaxID=3042023 RepID=A0ABT6JDH5_9GAMM|nr:HAD-IC family P-type ATPase [Luteimonas endophytica]MDH5824630.1 HAD-IC family P-type ATPase [Luteimonas endophytica]
MPPQFPSATPVPDVPWHACTAADALARLQADRGGLQAEEAARRLALHGANQLPATAGRPAWLRFLSQFNNALIYFLIAAACAAALLGHAVDAAVIAAVVVVNAVVGYVQEGKAERALDAIRRMVSPQATVLRCGQRQTVAVAALVPGDVVLLDPGDRVPADLRLLGARSLLIDEAVLTGESVAADKREAPVDAAAALGDRACMAWSGTLVAAGQGVGVVVATGRDTEIGRISTLIGGVQALTTPLLRQIDDFGRRFTWVALAGAAALFGFAVLVRGFRWDEALMAVVALAVGCDPGRAAGGDHHHPGDRGAAHGRAQRGDPQAACGGDARRHLALAMKAGLAPETLRAQWPRVDAIPFDAQHRFMATLHRTAEGRRVVFVKGAPERLLEMCAVQREASATCARHRSPGAARWAHRWCWGRWARWCSRSSPSPTCR